MNSSFFVFNCLIFDWLIEEQQFFLSLNVLFLINAQMNSSAPPMGMAVGMPEVKGLPPAVDLAKNPLAETHEFRQACLMCYIKTGQ